MYNDLANNEVSTQLDGFVRAVFDRYFVILSKIVKDVITDKKFSFNATLAVERKQAMATNDRKFRFYICV